MAVLNEFKLEDSFLQRVGFAVAALEYYVAIEESSLSELETFDSLWPSMVCAALHIQRAEAGDLEQVGKEFLQRYHARMIANPPQVNDSGQSVARYRVDGLQETG